MLNDQIEVGTYKVWYAKLRAERGAVEKQIVDLKKISTCLIASKNRYPW